jgi:hypothetical protein
MRAPLETRISTTKMGSGQIADGCKRPGARFRSAGKDLEPSL